MAKQYLIMPMEVDKSFQEAMDLLQRDFLTQLQIPKEILESDEQGSYSSARVDADHFRKRIRGRDHA